MTIRQKLEMQFDAHLLFPAEAKAVIERVAKKMPALKMDDPVTGYPHVLFVQLWMTAKKEAVAWMDECKPNHYARGMFT